MDIPHKACSCCGAFKPLHEFQVRRASSDGRTASCKECLHTRDRARYPKERDLRITRMQGYRKTEEGRMSHNKSSAAWGRRNRQKTNAQNALRRAIKVGIVTPWPVCAVPSCSCTTVHGHHPDYSRPLDVVWLCPEHHSALHAQHRVDTRAGSGAK